MSTTDVLNDVILPDILSATARGTRKRRTEITVNQAGFESRNRLWLATRREYELGLVPRTVAQWRTMEALYEVVDGAYWGFLLKDPIDSGVTVSTGLMGSWVNGALVGAMGSGYGVPVLRLHKRYTIGARSSDRLITRPRSAVTLFRAATPVTIGAAPGNAAVNYDTGTVTFVADATEAPTSYTVGATTVINFSSGAGIVAALAVGQRVYLSGVTGTAAAVLNGLSHSITAKGATSLTISTVTTGLTASGGTAAKYPQASEEMTWSGAFYVPVRFRDDDLEWDLGAGAADESARLIVPPSIVLSEIREA